MKKRHKGYFKKKSTVETIDDKKKKETTIDASGIVVGTLKEVVTGSHSLTVNKYDRELAYLKHELNQVTDELNKVTVKLDATRNEMIEYGEANDRVHNETTDLLKKHHLSLNYLRTNLDELIKERDNKLINRIKRKIKSLFLK